MDFDPNTLLFGGVILFPLLLFIVQTIREALYIESRFIPLVAIGVAILMVTFGTYAPERLVTAIGSALALAALVSTSVRYVKEGKEQVEPRESR